MNHGSEILYQVKCLPHLTGERCLEYAQGLLGPPGNRRASVVREVGPARTSVPN